MVKKNSHEEETMKRARLKMKPMFFWVMLNIGDINLLQYTGVEE